MHTIKIKRIYDKPASSDGYRILVDRLWPRVVKKETAAIDLWLKEIAPSNELRQWFHHEPDKWEKGGLNLQLQLLLFITNSILVRC